MLDGGLLAIVVVTNANKTQQINSTFVKENVIGI
jgi:hypothetical protein